MFLGLHGVVDVDAAVIEHWHQDDVAQVDDGINGLLISRADAYGWPSVHSSDGVPPGRRWWHLEAGGDWRNPGRRTEMIWVQVDVAPRSPACRLPFVPLTVLLTDALGAIGTHRLTGLHALVPMEAAADARAALASMAGWRELTAFRQPERAVRVRLEGLPDSVRSDVLAATAEDLAQGHLSCRSGAGAGTDSLVAGVATRPAGHERLREVAGGGHCLSFDCTVRGWGGETAAWLAELFVEALRQARAVRGSVLVALGT